MDRASFLRSLPYLRPLPPSTWNRITAEPSSSCSTATPPTPRSDDSTIVLEDVVVSIEPVYMGKNRKRGRDADAKAEGKPAFFLCKKEDIKEPPAIVNTAKTNDEKGEESDTASNQMNNDPALCSIEIAIVKRRHMIPSSRKKELLTTPDARCNMDIDNSDTYDLDANALLFRFGNYFVFEANASAILRIEHHNEYAGRERENDSAKQPEDGAETKDDTAHSSKRQRTEDGKQNTSVKQVKCPPSMCIYFPSCTFRVFSLESNKEAKKEKPNLFCNNGTGNRLSTAQSRIARHFDIGNAEATPWASCPLDKPEPEDWATCLDANIQPSKKASPTKTDSSSTHFENGQKSSDPKATGDDDSEGDHGETENSDTQPMDAILDVKSSQQKSSQKSTISDIFKGLVGSKSEASMGAKSEADPENISTNQMHEISTKRQYFDNCWSQIQESACNSNNSSLLTACAQSLDQSYCNPEQHAEFSEQCDLDIEAATSEVETLLEELMPLRGRDGSRSSTPSRLSSEGCNGGVVDHEQRIDDLLQKRKKALAAKYALFLVPKK